MNRISIHYKKHATRPPELQLISTSDFELKSEGELSYSLSKDNKNLATISTRELITSDEKYVVKGFTGYNYQSNKNNSIQIKYEKSGTVEGSQKSYLFGALKSCDTIDYYNVHLNKIIAANISDSPNSDIKNFSIIEIKSENLDIKMQVCLLLLFFVNLKSRWED